MNENIVDTLSLAPANANAHIGIVASKWALNGWTIIAIIELIIIVGLLLAHRRKKGTFSSRQKIKQEALSENVDFENIINSAFNSSELYKTLIVKCHPDRFPNDEHKNAIALDIFQQVSKNRNNAKALERLKERAEQELDISF